MSERIPAVVEAGILKISVPGWAASEENEGQLKKNKVVSI